jgi:hypothetical protein
MTHAQALAKLTNPLTNGDARFALPTISKFGFACHGDLNDFITHRVVLQQRKQRPPTLARPILIRKVRNPIDETPTISGCVPTWPDVWAQAHPEAIRNYRKEERRDRVNAKTIRREHRRRLQQLTDTS